MFTGCVLARALLVSAGIASRLWVRFKFITFVSFWDQWQPGACVFLAKTEMQEAKPLPACTFKASAHAVCADMSLAKVSHGASLSIIGTKKHTSFTQMGSASKPHGKGCQYLILFHPNISRYFQNTLSLSFKTFFTFKNLHLFVWFFSYSMCLLLDPWG